MSPRPYQKKLRGELEQATRRRIVEATSALHEEVGPAKTTIKEIAERAGVARPTVYKHFPDEQALFAACGAHFSERHPAPDPTPWASIADPAERLGVALGAFYAYYRSTERMTANVARDMELLPTLREVVEAEEGPYLEAVAGVLLAGWGVRGARRRRLEAAVTLALDFATWRRLARSGLDDDESVALMVALAAVAVGR